jgi:nucleoside-diphosphate-sugar epimerase
MKILPYAIFFAIGMFLTRFLISCNSFKLSEEDKKTCIIFKDLPVDDPIKRKPAILLARQLLNWEPKIDLIDGLKRTIFYFSEELKKS